LLVSRLVGKGAVGYDHLDVFVDDHGRLGFVALVEDKSRLSAARGARLCGRLLCPPWHRDRTGADRRQAAVLEGRYAATIECVAARHKRTLPYWPQANGSVERVIKTLLAQWAYARPYRPIDECRPALPIETARRCVSSEWGC
jgi:hypothetical protein